MATAAAAVTLGISVELVATAVTALGIGVIGAAFTGKLIEQIRPIINPNYGFVRQLEIFEELLKKNKYDIHSINFKEIKYPRVFEECCF